MLFKDSAYSDSPNSGFNDKIDNVIILIKICFNILLDHRENEKTLFCSSYSTFLIKYYCCNHFNFNFETALPNPINKYEVPR